MTYGAQPDMSAAPLKRLRRYGAARRPPLSGLRCPVLLASSPTQSTGGCTNDPASLSRDGVVVGRRPAPRELLEGAAARRGARRGQAGRPRRRVVQAFRRRLLPRHGRRRQARPGGDRGPQHVDGLERRQRPLLGQHERLHLRRLRPAQGRQLAPDARLHARHRAGTTSASSTSRASRARRRPTRTGAASGSTSARKGCAADPFEDESKYPGVAIGARGKPLGDGTTLPVGSFYGYASGIVGLRLFPEPGVRREGGQGLGPRALLHRPELLQPQGPGAPVPRRHVVRLLPRRPEPGESARRSGASGVREPQLVGGRAVHVGRPALHLQLEQARGPQELHVPARPHLPPGHAWTPRWSRPTASTIRAR